MSHNIIKVLQFTEQSTGKKITPTRRDMTFEEVVFLVKMVLSEMAELFQTKVGKDEALSILNELASNGIINMMSELDSIHHAEIPLYPLEMSLSDIKMFAHRIVFKCLNFIDLTLNTAGANTEGKEVIKNCIGVDVKECKLSSNQVQLIAEQADACADAVYYILNAACKCYMFVEYPIHHLMSDQEIILENLIKEFYYVTARRGVDLDAVFSIVHHNNMNKRWEDGQFHRREDGYIIKPTNWDQKKCMNDVVVEIERQMKLGCWN